MNPRPTGNVRRTEHGADLVLTRSFRGRIADVWQSLTASEKTARWIGPWQGEPGPGKTVRLVMAFEEGPPACNVLITACEAPRRLALSMKDDYGDWNLELSLREQEDCTEIVFVQHLADPKLAGDTGPGWEYYLDRALAAHAGQSMRPFEDYYPAQKQYYLDQAGTPAERS